MEKGSAMANLGILLLLLLQGLGFIVEEALHGSGSGCCLRATKITG